MSVAVKREDNTPSMTMRHNGKKGRKEGRKGRKEEREGRKKGREGRK